MAVPAAALAEEEGAEATAAASGTADEAEYDFEEYEDIGGVEDPSKYYKVGDAVKCFVLSVEEDGKKIELTQFADDADDDVIDDGDDEEDGNLLAQLDPEVRA